MLMERPWFCRRWVVQETAFAAVVFVQCGSQSLTLAELSKAILFLHYYGLNIWKVWQSRVHSQNPELRMPHGQGDLQAQRAKDMVVEPQFGFWRAPGANSHRRRFRLETLMTLFQDLKVSDQRDIVYALIPLAKDVHDSREWLPDY